MCGIVGQLNFSGPVKEDIFRQMNGTLVHRGPDGEGYRFAAENRIALGHRRLALIDLSPKGAQPMGNEDQTVWLTCNGEIYNYIELRQELKKLGHRFLSASDSEVIIHAYEQWGIEAVQKLKGMFAFCLLDEKKQKLFLVRDRFGIKPLYYYHDSNRFIFGSEIKAIIKNPDVVKELDFSSLCDFLVYRYIPNPKSIWKRINKLPPAHWLEVNFNGIMKLHEYWSITSENRKIKEKDMIEQVHELITQSAKLHLRSDVPVGTFLSGGYDSSALVYYQAEHQYSPITFSAGFEGWKESEHTYAAMVSEKFHTKHYHTMLNESSFDVMDKLMYYYDEPLGDISIIPTYLVSKLAAGHVKTVLSGEGADEIFCGYTWHVPPKKNFFSQFLLDALDLSFYDYSLEQYAGAMAMGRFTFQGLADLLPDDLGRFIPRNPEWFYKKHYDATMKGVKKFQFADIKTFMGELVLTKVDRASMAHSLEVRVPYLDHELVEFIFQLNPASYFRRKIKKFPLRENIKKHLPEKILNRPKQGFVGPDSYYMNYKWYNEVLSNGKLIREKFIREEKLTEMLEQKDHWRLWKLAVLEFWLRKWN